MESWLRACLAVAGIFAGVLATAPGHAAQYVVDGFRLGERVASAGANYRSYTCRPSDDFADAMRCERTQQISGRAGGVTVVHTLIHARDGTAIYVMANAATVMLNRTSVEAEIESLSRAIGERPAEVKWAPADSSGRSAVIALWGGVKLEEIGGPDLDTLAAGKSPHLGVLVDYLGDLQASAQGGPAVFRITGGRGYLYSASFDAKGRGHRHYVVVDPAQLAIRMCQLSLQTVLQKDRSLAADDYRLWPEVAIAARKLARDTSPAIANGVLNQVFDASHSSKLRSDVWSILPAGAIQRLAAGQYSKLDMYGPKTHYPQVRRDVESFLASHPSDPYAEFVYYLIGEFDEALKANPNSVIADVLHYAVGYRIVQSIVQDALVIAKAHITQKTAGDVQESLDSLHDDLPDTEYPDAELYVDGSLRFINQNPGLFEHKPLSDVMADFSVRAAAAQPHFAAVLRHPSSALSDDAAYMLGWLALQQGKSSEALDYFSKAMVVGNGDYKRAALKEAVRILEPLPPNEQLRMVQSSAVFTREPALWYEAARSAYRDFDYALAIDIGQLALKAFDIPINELPVTTDPDRIEAALERVNPDLSASPNVDEMPYLIEASRQILQYEAYLNSAGTVPPDVVAQRARTIIVKYSMLLDRRDQPAHAHIVAHKDLRQAIHLIDMTLQRAPKAREYARLRQWLYYRKVRVSAVFAPKLVPRVIAAMQQEFPNSVLLNDALAEQIFAEGIMLKDPDAAERTFHELLRKYPDGNAVDNAYSWMEIVMACAGRMREAQDLNREIIQRFPLTRHAKYARERLAHQDRSIDRTNCGD